MIKLTSTQQKVLEIYHNDGHVKAWNYWTLLNQKGVIFLGEVSSNEFIDGESLANHIGLKACGGLFNNDTPWLKFILNGDLVYVPMKPLMHSVSWQNIYYTGAVYGDDDYGNERISPYTKQNAKVAIGDKTYKVMLINTTSVEMGDKSTFDNEDEWNQLFIPIMKKPCVMNEVVDKHFQYWGRYTEEDLLMGVNYGLGSYCWMRNTNKHGDDHDHDRRCVRGGSGVLNQFQFKPTSNYRGRGWRPLLRLC